MTVLGISGAGYIIFDQATGNGAYKISGGLSGGRVKVGFLDNFLFKLSLFMDAAPNLAKFLKFAGYFEVLVSVIGILEGLVDLYNKCKNSINIFTGFALLSIFVGFGALISLEIATLAWNPLAVFAIAATVQVLSSRVLTHLNRNRRRLHNI